MARVVLRWFVTAMLMAAAAANVAPAAPAADDADPVVTIVHKDNPHPIDRRYVAGIYTGRVRTWPDGSPVLPLDVGEGSRVRTQFYTRVVGKSEATMQALWSKNIFAGRGLPPTLAPQGGEMKRLVATNRNAIGYLRASEADDSVKVIDP